MEDDDFRDIVERFGTSTKVFADRDRSSVQVAVSTIFSAQLRKWTALIDDARGRGVTWQLTYKSDGWGADIARHRTVEIGAKRSQQVGLQRMEFLAQKSILKSIASEGQIQMAMRLHPARAMTGKAGWDISKSLAWNPSCATCSHPTGIIVS